MGVGTGCAGQSRCDGGRRSAFLTWALAHNPKGVGEKEAPL